MEIGKEIDITAVWTKTMADDVDDADDSPSATVTRSDSDANWKTKTRESGGQKNG